MRVEFNHNDFIEFSLTQLGIERYIKYHRDLAISNGHSSLVDGDLTRPLRRQFHEFLKIVSIVNDPKEYYSNIGSNLKIIPSHLIHYND